MVIFHSYVSLPEGSSDTATEFPWKHDNKQESLESSESSLEKKPTADAKLLPPVRSPCYVGLSMNVQVFQHVLYTG